MTRRNLISWLLLAATATLVRSQFEDASLQSWQPSRTRKSQTPSLLSNVQSSQQFTPSQRDPFPVTSQGTYTPFRPSSSARQGRIYQQTSAQGNVAVPSSAPDAYGGFQANLPTGRGRFSSREPFSTSEATAVLADVRGESVRQAPRRGAGKSNRNYASIDNSDFGKVSVSGSGEEQTTRGYSRRPVVPSSAPAEVRQNNERSRGRSFQRTTQPTPRSFVSSNTPTSRAYTQTTEPSARLSFSQKDRRINSGESKESKPVNRFALRAETAPSAPASTRVPSRKSSENFSAEETLIPRKSATTERSTVDAPYTQANLRGSTRGRVRASFSQPQTGTTPRTRQVYRGEKKAGLPKELKQKDGAISDDDNYPKEFIEKIKNSGEVNLSPKEQPRRSVSSGSRFSRSRPPPPTFVRPSIDPDISESANEEVIEQNVPETLKPKEIPPYTRHRFFGKNKTSTTTEQPTTKTPPKPGQASSIDTMRQRYNTMLKANQEERLKKLASMRSKFSQPTKSDEPSSTSAEPLVENDKSSTTARSLFSSSRYSQFPKAPKKMAEKLSQAVAKAESQNGSRFRPRVSLTSRQPDPSIEPATPTVADNARTRNRYSRRSKEELSVEAPEAKTFARNSNTPHDSIFNFVHLRTNLTPLASEDVISSFLSNELGETVATSTVQSSTSAEVMPSTTTRAESSSMETSMPTMTEQSSAETTRLSVERTTAPFGDQETTTITRQDPSTMVTVPSTMVTEVPETAAPSPQSFPSTRHRFSSRYNGSASSSPVPEKFTEVPSVESEISTTLSALNLSRSLSSGLFSTTVPPTVSAALTPISTTTARLSTSEKTTTPKRVTTEKSFLDDKPILKSIISLFTTTKRPTTVQTQSKPTNKQPKKPATTVRVAKTTKPATKPTTPRPTTSTTATPSISTAAATPPQITPVTTTTTRTVTTSTEDISNNTISPLALAVNIEEVLNSTQELVNNHSTSSYGSEFSKVPRDELDALTPLSVLNTTDAVEASTIAPMASTTDMTSTQSPSSSTDRNVNSQPIFFVGVLATPSPTPLEVSAPTQRSTTPSTTTAGDYFVYGIYPNNTVVRKRAWKTFDYERYMSPYVIFGIYPNNTIVRKFPNGTVINDDFMTSDNEVAGPSLSSGTTAPTITSEATASSAMSTSTTMMTPDATERSLLTTLPMTTPAISDDSSSITTEMPPQTTANQGEDAATTMSPTEAVTVETTEDNELDGFILKSNLNLEDSTENSVTEEMVPTTTAVGTTVDDIISGRVTSFPVIMEDTTATSAATAAPTTAIPTVSVTTAASTTKEDDVTTVDPSTNQVLPLTLEEVQSLWSGNFSDAPAARPLGDTSFFNGINFLWNENRMPSKTSRGKPVSLANIAFRALGTSSNEEMPRSTTPFVDRTTTEEMTTMQATTTRKPRVKFVTVTPRFMTTTLNYEDFEDSATLPSQHVQRVSKASTQLPEDVFTNLFGSLEQEASSPIPDLKDVDEVEGDGLTAALARRIIALAMERAKSTTTDAPTTTTMVPTTEISTLPPTTTFIRTTAARKKKPAGRAIVSPQNIQNEGDLRNVLEQLIKAQDTLASSTGQMTVTSVKPPADLEKTVENQLRLAEEVRKASRNMKKKKKKSRPPTTTPAPRPILGFLFNFFNRPATEKPPTTVPSRTKVPASANSPDSQLLFVTSVDDSQSAEEEPAGNEVQGERQTRSQLLTAAIDVTRAVGKLMGTVMSSAAQSFQSFVRTNWGR